MGGNRVRCCFRGLLAVAVFVSALAGVPVAGCRPATEASVPFLVSRCEISQLPTGFDRMTFDFYPASWQPERQTLSLGDTLAYREDFRAVNREWSNRTHTSWDGGRRVAVNAVMSDITLDISAISADYVVDRVEPPMDGFYVALNAPSDSEERILLGAYAGGWAGHDLVLEFRRGGNSRKMTLELPGSGWDPHSLIVPMFVGLEGEDTVVLVLASKLAPDGGGDVPRMLLCCVRDNGQKDWTEVDDRDAAQVTRDAISHGAPSVARLGDLVYVVATNRLAALDLDTATLRPATAINDTLNRLIPGLEKKSSVSLAVGVHEPYLLVVVPVGETDQMVVAFAGDRLAGQLRIATEGLALVAPSGEIGRFVPWPGDSRGNWSIRLPGLPWQ